MNRYITSITTAVALSVSSVPPVSAADLIETAATSSSFKIFLAAAKTSGLTDTLRSSGPYTVFAPSDSAFNKLPPGTLKSLLKDKEWLAKILLHHVVPGKMTVTDVKPGKVSTLQGSVLTLTSDNGKVTVDDANVIQSDLVADNGVIHEIDTVVLPQQ